MSNTQPIGSHRFNVFIGVVGLLLAIMGNLVPPHSLAQKWLYFISAVLLLLSAILERQLFFIVLEIVIVAGTAIAFTPLTLAWKAGLPILLSIAAIVYFIKQGLLRDGL